MAKMGIEATGMSEANTGAAKFVKQPVAPVPNTMLGMAAGLASDAYTGYQMADLEKKQEGIVTDYMNRNHGTAGIEAAALKSGIEGIWNNFDTTIEDVNPIEKTLQEKLSKYKAAKDQGIMSPQEFSDRILATTREAINKNPGMYDELKKHSQKMLDQSGITSVLNQDIAASQNADKMLQKLQEHYLSQAGKLNRPIPLFNDGGINFAALKEDVDKYELQESLVQQSKQAILMADNDVHAAALQWAQSNGPDIIHGSINNSMYKGITMLKEGTDWQTAASAIRMDLNMHRQDIVSQVAPFMNDPIIKEHLAYLDKQASLVEEMLTKQFTNEDGLKYLANTTQMFRDKDYMAYAQTVGSPEALKAWTGMVQAIGPGKYAADNSEAMGKMYRTIGDLANGVIGSMNTDYTLKANGTNLVADGVKNLANMAATDNKVVPQLENMFKTINADLENPDKFKTKEAKFNFYTDAVRAIADPKSMEGIKKMGGGAYSDAAKLVDSYMNFTIPDLNIKVTDYEDKGVKVQMDVLPDGRTVFQTSDPAATRDLNARYAGRINDSLKAFANLMGSDITTVAKTHFYEAYLPQLLGDKDLKPLALHASDVPGAVKSGALTAEQGAAIEASIANDPEIARLENIIATTTDSAASSKAQKKLDAYRLKVYGIK
jgi:hypothetical protein